jgi:hypothetical protein
VRKKRKVEDGSVGVGGAVGSSNGVEPGSGVNVLVGRKKAKS